MFNGKSEKDEIADSVEKSSYSLGFKVMAFAILLDVIYRSIVLKSAAWDLLSIVIFGGLTASIYQARYRIATRSWIKVILLSIVSAGLIAVIVAVMLN